MIKKLSLFLFTFISSFQIFAQNASPAYLEYMKSLENLIQNELYSQVSEILYDVEEVPDYQSYINFCKEVDEKFNQHYGQYEKDMGDSEKKSATQFSQAMMIQLAELYLDRAQEMDLEERKSFFKEYLSQLGLIESITEVNEDISRSISMNLHAVLGIPFGMPNTEVGNYVQTESEPVKELFQAAYLLNEMSMLTLSFGEIEKLASNFKVSYPNSQHLTKLESTLLSLENLKEGALVQDFNFVDLEGNSVSLSRFKDKIIYIDLWASWCGPCINTFRTKTPDFERKLRDREDVVLMYISIDEKQEPWKNYLDKNPMRGVHLFAGKGFEADIMKYFKVWGIPRYLIIGKDNKLISPNAPRPGDEAYELLIALD
ncbi:TlpA family protein disulfide reductase [Shivajiella indica]|uniref:TlpA family protein disulfide reductase n=1 Tax=Shivajiella indica TaxID=872115 RepID=A0ABW5B4G0_9BACT